ncbi:MAG TPA: 4Fe-4S ferredoxin [Thermodesulfobacteriaceae bacterium]|nr:4Fe-4S ferredoxin [Thermodesulfobacteriaceae bacterium]
MNEKFILRKDHLTGFLRKLSKGHRLVAPVRNRYGDLMFQVIDSLETTDLDLSEQAQESPKAFFLPQEEVLFSYEASGGIYDFRPINNSEQTVYFGLRSCDISAILYMDVIFLRSPRDDHYMKKRKDSILISIGCNTPGENCFCNATRTGPFLEYGFDLQFTDLGDRFFVESGRARGDEIFSEWPQFFHPVTEEDVRLQYQLALEAKAGFRRQIHVEPAFSKLRDDAVDTAVWREMASRCDGCGGCAYICPTCTCFTIFDRMESTETGKRIRAWDSCTHAGFTRMAGGHNPVDMKIDALRRRFMHKLYYDYSAFRRPSCVGCGRCVDMCFGGVDIVKFIDIVCAGTRKRTRDSRRILGDLLLEAGLISRTDLEKALSRQADTGEALGKILMDLGLVTCAEILGVLSLENM